VAAVLAGVVAALGVGTPAFAHSADVPAASDFRCRVTGISPALPGLTVRAISAGTELELVNHTGRAIEVLGYSGEPYLRVGPDGVFQNANSPAAYTNETLRGGPAPPASAGAAAAPDWQRLSTTPAVVWHDHRASGTGAVPGDGGGSPERILSWSVPLRDGVRVFAVTGTLDWVPRPATATWWAGCLLLAAAVAVLGRWRPRWAGAASIVAGVAAVAYAAGAAVDGGGLGFTGVLRLMITGQTWAVLCGLAAVAAGIAGVRRARGAELGYLLAGLCVTVFAGLVNAGVFAHAIGPVPVARPLILGCVAGGAGVAVAGLPRPRYGAAGAGTVSGVN
jgi:hypothetical protein